MPTSGYTSLTEFRATLGNLSLPDMKALAEAEARNAQLTKPAGSLGRLEDIAVWYAGWRGTAVPTIEAPQIIVFAANHGVTAQNISAFPPEVTSQMVLNFEHGGAAINQLSKLAGASLDVVPIELDNPTKDFTVEAAMTEAELCDALSIGAGTVSETSDILVLGEMGIGNTTSASAILHALFSGQAQDWVGRGTGLDDDGVRHKAEVVGRAVKLHVSEDPLELLRALGGREIAAIAGAMVAARSYRIPVILDGFIATAAAAVLHMSQASALDHVIAGHKSAETAHATALEKIGKPALLDLGLRLGEGSGAALAIQIVKGALVCHSGMATFAEAGVSDS